VTTFGCRAVGCVGADGAGWHAHKLNAPGKFLCSAPEHDTLRRARAYLLTDADVAGMAARYAPARPPLDPISRMALATRSLPASRRQGWVTRPTTQTTTRTPPCGRADSRAP